jgi:hypothetical protein
VTSPDFTNALELLERNRLDALKWIVECCNKSLDFNDISLEVKPRNSEN